MKKTIKKTVLVLFAVIFVVCASVVTGAAEASENRPAGDINGDGLFTETDSVSLARWLAGWNVTIDKAYADVNADDTVDEKDAVLVSRSLAGWNVELKINLPENQFPTIDEVMEYIDIPSKPGVALSYYTAVDVYDGADYAIYTYTDLTESVKRTVYMFIGSEEKLDEFKSLHYIEARQNGWKYIEECPGLVRISYSDGYMFNPNTEYPQAENNPDNTLYYGKKS